MEHIETLTEIRRLLELYEGVTIDFIRNTSTATRIVFCVNNEISLARIVHCTMGANIPIHVWSRAPGMADEDEPDPAYLRYEFVVPNDPPTKLEILGIHFVWHLARRKMLDHAEATRLLAAWHGAPREM